MIALIYPILLIGGFLGLLIMAALGFAHGGSGGHDHAGHGHLGHGGHDASGIDVQLPGGHAGHGALGHGHAGGHGAAGAGHAHGGHAPAASGQAGHGHGTHTPVSGGNSQHAANCQSEGAANALFSIMPFVSPLNWFSWMLGAGAVGVIVGGIGHVAAPVVAGCALLGAAGFNLGVVKPLWKLIFAFASKPAQNLGGCLAQTVEAVSAFNERGEGLVRIIIDGRSDDILARLVSEELASGVRVRRGDRLLIEEVDVQRNRCRVSRL